MPDDPIIMINHPNKGTRIQGRTGRYDNQAIDETKNCAGCEHLKKNIISTTHTGYRLSEEHLKEIVGICTWGAAWKIVWHSVKPKKCVKLSAAFVRPENISSGRILC
jgi:hypothetical protein